MTPTQTPDETRLAQEDCAKAWAESRLRNGVDRMKLIYQAFPHSVNAGGTSGGLRFTWIEKSNALGVSDEGGFLTLLDEEVDPAGILQQIFTLLSMESTDPGAVRELITGVPRKHLSIGIEKRLGAEIEEKTKLSLKDLGI